MTPDDPKQIFTPEWLASLRDVLGMIQDYGVEELVLDPKRSRGALYRSLIPPPSASVVSETDGANTVLPGTRNETVGVASRAENADATRGDRIRQLEELRGDMGDCRRCRLHQGRTQLVFGEGDPLARLMFVGEGPGADEDRLGRPFVGRAGQLLDRMIQAMGLAREKVFIANVVKCRPPGNRTPEPDEAEICGRFLLRQVEILQPDLLICLGLTAAKYVLNTTMSLSSLRGCLARAHGTRVLTTYHPAYLLRQPSAKRDAWEDLQKAMALLGIKAAAPSLESE